MSANVYHRSPWGRRWTAQLHRHEPRPVWVDLAHAFAQPATPPTSQHGYQLAGEVRGELHEWVLTRAGWYGIVEFDPGWHARRLRQLIPATALRERDDGRALNGTRRR